VSTKKHFSRLSLIIFIALFVSHTSLSFANPEVSNSDVTATVATGGTFSTPILISPADNLATNSARFTFHWRRPSPLPTTTLDHYDLFIDDAVFAAAVSDTLSTADYYFYTATRASEFFYVGLKQDLAQGYHTWRVAVYDTIGTNAATGNWRFYIDSIAPFISFTKLNTTAYTWNTAVSGSIPAESSRYLTVYSNNPTLKGGVETNANLQISLVCPAGAPSGCTNQSWIINSTDGNWEKQFSSLIANINYTVNLSATDATNNTTVFPSFYLKYSLSTSTTSTPTAIAGTATPTVSPTLPPLTATPTQTALPTISSSLTPPADLSALVTPTQFIPKTPPAPTLPPQKTTTPKSDNGYGFLLLWLFLCLGLPTHLLMASIGVGSKVKNILSFLYTLGFPFLKRKNSQTIPFSFVEVYDPSKLQKPIHTATSDINGEIYFPDKLPKNVLITLKNTNYFWKDQIIQSLILQYSCLTPTPKHFLDTKENLQNTLYSLKTIPLVVAILSSSIGLFYFPSSYLAGYLYLSLQYAFSEYAYPKTKKQ